MIYKYIHTTSNFSISTNDIYNRKLRILVSKSITDLFSGFLKSNAKTTEINFKFTDRIGSFINMNDYTRLNNIKISDNQVYYKDHEIEFITKKDSYEVIINIIDNESLISHLKIFNKAFKNNIESQVSTFYYRIFLFFTQLWNIKNNFSYLHSSAIQVNDKGILFTSSSGTGKSSLLLKVFNHNVNFIADDLTTIIAKSESAKGVNDIYAGGVPVIKFTEGRGRAGSIEGRRLPGSITTGIKKSNFSRSAGTFGRYSN